MSPAKRQYEAALASWDAANPPAPSMSFREQRARRALGAAWWFIENVGPDDPGRSDVFFRVRGLVREAGR